MESSIVRQNVRKLTGPVIRACVMRIRIFCWTEAKKTWSARISSRSKSWAKVTSLKSTKSSIRSFSSGRGRTNSMHWRFVRFRRLLGWADRETSSWRSILSTSWQKSTGLSCLVSGLWGRFVMRATYISCRRSSLRRMNCGNIVDHLACW